MCYCEQHSIRSLSLAEGKCFVVCILDNHVAPIDNWQAQPKTKTHTIPKINLTARRTQQRTEQTFGNEERDSRWPNRKIRAICIRPSTVR